ncbi:MAG: EamA family transporter RarD [Rhodobacteraceae bacterium]|nr:EamA family transporter RarD [Paracoccaceae bacterium]
MNERTKGILAMASASIIWGLSGIYYKELAHIPPLEVLGHRTLWSFVFFVIVITIQGRLSVVWGILRQPRTFAMLMVSAVMISTNWFVFILSIQKGWAMEASFGYYIFPLVAVALGYLVLGERLSKPQKIAVAIAAGAVIMLGVGLGNPPWISLTLATTFGAYGLIKNKLDVGPEISVFIEVLVLTPVALIWLFGVHKFGWSGAGRSGAIFGTNLRDSLMLIFSGVLTAVPLILFSYAARRVTLTTIGLVQYLNPTLQFMVATFIFTESFTKWHAVAFPLIWTGLAIYSIDSLRQERSARKRRINSGTSETT